jgi:hypothetical protein
LPVGDAGTYTYALVGGLAFAETAGFAGLVAPGELAILLGHAFVVRHGAASCPTPQSQPASGGAQLCVLGYLFWGSIDDVLELISRGSIGLAVLAAIVAGAIALHRQRRLAAQR